MSSEPCHRKVCQKINYSRNVWPLIRREESDWQIVMLGSNLLPLIINLIKYSKNYLSFKSNLIARM